jgi:transcriptional regulator with XRE-family HTH domain
MPRKFNYDSPLDDYFYCFDRHKYRCVPLDMNIGDRLRQARLEAGLTQSQLAEASVISQQMISKIERGASVGTTSLVPLALTCGVRPEWLHTGIGAKSQPALQEQESTEVQELAAAYATATMSQRQALLTIARSFKAGSPDEPKDDKT